MHERIAILGGGFAGLAALGELARHGPPGLAVHLVDRREDSVFSPLLPDLISARVSARHMRHPLRPHCEGLGARFTRTEVQRILPEEVAVETDAGRFGADALLICLGCENNYFGDEQARAGSIGLKTVEEGLTLRRETRRCAERLLAGGRCPVVVVGGGYTGFEVASHVAYALRRLTGRTYDELRRACPLLIVDKAPGPLQNVSGAVRRWAVELIGKFGVELRTECTVERFGKDGVMLSDGTQLAGALVAWAAGVTPGRAVDGLEASKGRGGRLEVDRFLRLRGAQRVFAAGDVAAAIPPGRETPLRMAVQFSLAGGRQAGRNTLRALAGEELEPFEPTDLGYVVPLAPGEGAGVVLGRETWGRLPSMLHYAMCSVRSWSWENRFGILADLRRRDVA
ncbi:FAD-dependent oxidoreductase [Hydrogenophaga sp.]|uniref:NAD(P)/FAD-dependent oxidoreductase n=1 Tax=Hydrogenophaga sp. TaxID=1904254 RepID=UPI00169D18F5|nr:FAD-dependent oxidoreductase [Hydrogenophaga sp.]NIM71200.1 FAD-dependent oxidoreductase [Xanthomonadales bacterium]NIO14288.1 FAD-dependent oxidoreductase [Xanthomonadales bacterium]NIO51852.1 FAD-dependent oxidoreductase [Hydrogenophaga sp.]NIQ62389.1 FAD-dependent oxidoreductase [Hydrogenophaga sp.]NIS97963.1 FAD-dependent oxidoreductase [Hydrogenophaga sp.]